MQGIVSIKSSPSPTLHHRQPTNEYKAILSEFPAVTQPCHKEQPVKHNITHHIATTGPPVSSRTRRLSSERVRVARRVFEYMLDLGIVWLSSS